MSESDPTMVYMFEGSAITEMDGVLPSITIEMPEGYTRGTHLRLNLEVRVKNVRYEENRKGDLVRKHVFALEAVQLVSAFQPEEAVDAVGGSASATPEQTPEEAAEIGVVIGRTSGLWENATDWSADKSVGF